MVPGGHLPRVPHRALAACRGLRLSRQDALAGARARRPHRALAASPGRLTGLAALGRASPTRSGHGAPVVVAGCSCRIASLTVHVPSHDSWLRSLSPTPGVGRFRLRRGSPVQLRREPQAWVVIRGHHGHEGLSQVVGHQAAQPSTTSGQGQKILGRGRVPRCVSTNAGTRRSGAPRRGSRRGRQGQQGHVRRQARGAPRYEQRHENHRQAPAEQHKATTPEASAPRSGSPSGQTRRAQERAPASHREERQAATPTKAAQLTQGGRRPSSSDTRSEASRITCETRAEGRPREPTAWGRGARGRFLGRPVSPESCGKVPIDRGDAFSWPHRGRLIGLGT